MITIMNTLILRKTINYAMGAMLGLLPLSSDLKADFALLDDLESAQLGPIPDDPTSLWVAHGNTNLIHVLEESDNQYLGVSWTGGFRAGSLPLTGSQIIAPGEMATLFLQFRAPPLTANSSQAVHFGLGHAVDTTSSSPFADYRAEVRLRPGPSSDHHYLDVRDGGGWKTLTTVRRDVWHSIWFVIDRTDGDSYRLYLNTSDGSAQAGDLLVHEQNGIVTSSFAFRSGGSSDDLLDSVLAVAHAAINLGLQLDNLWLDKTGQNLSFVGEEFNAWMFEFASFQNGFDLTFGTGADTVDDFIVWRSQDFVIQSDSVGFQTTSDSFVPSLAMAAIDDILPRQGFTLEGSFTLNNLQNVGTQQVGLAVLGEEHLPPGQAFNASNSDSFYGLTWVPAEPGNPTPSFLRIRRGLTGEILHQEDWGGLHPSIVNAGQGGIGEIYHIKAEGSFDPGGLLILKLTLTDSNGFSQTVSATGIEPREGNLFGFGGRIANVVSGNTINPRFDFHNLSLTLADEPTEITDPIALLPFGYDFGSGEGRDGNGLLRQNLPDEWSLQSEALRLIAADPTYHRSLSSVWVTNYDLSQPFTAKASATLAGLTSETSDYRLGLVLLGDPDREVFDADDNSYYTMQLIPNAASGASLVVRRGMNGTVLHELGFSELSNPPATVPGSTYDFEFTGIRGEEGQLLFMARVTDQNGAKAEILAEIVGPIPGNRFGFGAWHRSGDNAILDVSSFALIEGVGVGGSAIYLHNDVVLGLAERDSWLAYNSGTGNGHIGSGGGGGNLRHQNPVLGFHLPDVPLDRIRVFELTVMHRSRTDHAAHLYGLLPENPSIYNDGSITPDADGIDVWYQGSELDDRAGLIGAAWADVIPSGVAAGATYAVDVTDFIRTFYDENGPTREKVFFRLSSATTWAANELRRIEIETAIGNENAPSLNYVVYPPIEPEPVEPMPTAWNFGNDAERDGDGGFAKTSQRGPGWSVTGDALNHTTDDTGNWNIYSATTPVTALSPGEDFELSMTATVVEVGGSSTFKTFGMVFLGEAADSAFDPATDNVLTATFAPELDNGNGQIRINTSFSGTRHGSLNRSSGSVANGTVYVFTVKGTYAPNGDLAVEFSVTDDAVAAPQVLSTTIPAASVPVGDRFGFGGRQMANASVDFNSFEIIPVLPGDINFASWRDDVFTQAQLNDTTISGALASPAGDGVANLVKYAMDLDPFTPVSSSQLFTTGVFNGQLRITYYERTDVSDIDYVVEVSSDLATWDSGSAHVEEISRNGVGGNLEEVTKGTLLPPEAARGFMQLNIQQK
jgi:hypothetical protein